MISKEAKAGNATAKVTLPQWFDRIEEGILVMKFEYTGRHVEVSPAIRKHVEDHFKKLDHIFNNSATNTT